MKKLTKEEKLRLAVFRAYDGPFEGLAEPAKEKYDKMSKKEKLNEARRIGIRPRRREKSELL